MIYLEKHLAGAVPPGKGEEWSPLITYRNALAQGEYDLAMAPPMVPRQGRGRPPKNKRRLEGGCCKVIFCLCALLIPGLVSVITQINFAILFDDDMSSPALPNNGRQKFCY